MIPADVRHEIEDYLKGNHPYPFGSFITAVLANDFCGAVAHADSHNKRLLVDYAEFLYMKMPGRTGNPNVDWWGSHEAVSNRIRENRERLADAQG